MALSRELLKRLNTEDEPLPKRLKLAETTFSMVDLPLIQKEDVVLNWLCKICVTNQHAWKTLNNCLKFTLIDTKTNIKQCLIDMLTRTLNNPAKEIYEEVLECCTLILANNNMRQYFIKKPKDLGLLVKTLFDTMSNRSGCQNETQKEKTDMELVWASKLSSTESCTAINIIESIMQIYKQSMTTKEEIKITFIHDILYSMCNLIDYRYTDNTNKLGVAAYKCIQQVLLGKRNIQNNQTAENSPAMFQDLFSVLSENVRKLKLQSNLATYSLIFRAAVGVYKSDVILLDTFFRNLINTSGRYKSEILNLYLPLFNDISFDFENAVEDVTLSECIQKFINDILTNDNMTHVQYEILVQLSYINPLLIERNIPNILNKIFMEEQSVDHTNLLIAVLYASTKLRREQKFISQLLQSLKQHVTIGKQHKTSRSAFFPQEFMIKLTRLINNASSSQTIASLKTLIYHLNTDCVELLQCNTSCKNVLLLKATVELLVALLEGMQILEYTRVSSVHEKFINTLQELGNALSLLINKALCLNHNKKVIIILLTAVQSLSKMQNMLKYYVPKIAVIKTLSFPIHDDPWQQLIQRISNFGEDNCKNIMNKLILHRIKLNLLDEPIKHHNLIGGLEYAWSTILKHDPNILSLLRDKEISKVTCLLLTDMTSSEKNFHEWLTILDKECIQENKCFQMCLLSHILVQIGQCFLSGCTKSLTEHINTKLLMQDKHNENEKLVKVLQVAKEQISQQQRTPITNAIPFKIEMYLEILLHAPIMYLSPNTRTLIFLIVYSISREYETDEKASMLCNSIFSDLLEKTGIDIFQYIEPTVLVNQLLQNKAFSKACELSLRSVTTYSTFKNLIKGSAHCKEVTYTILERMEMVRSKLNPEQKIIFKKAERKIAKAILSELPEEIYDTFDVRCLTAVLKVAISTKKITDTLKELIKSTLQNIFTIKNPSNLINGVLIQDGVQLATIVLRHRKEFEIQDVIIENLWIIMLRHPHKNLRKALLASTRLKEFYKFVRLLHDETIMSLSQADEATWTNLLIVWSDIIKTDMHMKRSKMRFDAINSLLETAQSSHIPDKCWSDLVSLSHDIINTKHLIIPNDTFDLIITTSLRSFEKMKISSCENVLALCGALIRVRANLITDNLPALLLLYRGVVNIIVHASKTVSDKFEEHRFRCLALDIEKLTSLLIKLKKDMMRLSPYLIADLLQSTLESSIPSYIKVALQNSLCHLIGICDQYGISLLSRTLPVSLQEIFKVQLNTFNKFYKYSGKI